MDGCEAELVLDDIFQLLVALQEPLFGAQLVVQMEQ